MADNRNQSGNVPELDNRPENERAEFHVSCGQDESAQSCTAERIMEHAVSLGHHAIGIVGIDGIHSFIEAEKAAKRFGLKPIFGIRATLVTDAGKAISCYIYVRNGRGKRRLNKLISLSGGFKSDSGLIVSLQELEADRTNLIVSSGPFNEELLEAVYRGTQAEAEELVRYFDVLTIGRWNPAHSHSARSASYTRQEWEQINRGVCELGARLGQLVIATGRAAEAVRLEEDSFNTTDELIREFSYLGAAEAYAVVVSNTRELAARFEPYELIPRELFLPHMEAEGQHLRTACYDAARARYGEPIPQPVLNRLDKELDFICDYGFASPYLIAKSVADKSKEDGYPVRPRGSVGSSIVAYFLGITDTNPLPPHALCGTCKQIEWIPAGEMRSGFDGPDRLCSRCGDRMQGDGHNIPYEMFLGLRGNKVPDIDLNVGTEYQVRAQSLVREQLGEDNVILAGRLNGSVHPCGLLLIPGSEEAEQFTAVMDASPDGRAGWKKSYFDYRHLKDTIYKFDILGHDDPSMMKLLHSSTGLDSAAIPMNDVNVLSLFRTTAALGVTPEQILSPVATYGLPEMGPPFVRRILEETKPDTFSDLIQISGLTHGTGVWEGNAQELIRVGQCTLQTAIACRDDIMLTLVAYGIQVEAAFCISENVRKGRGLSDAEAADMSMRSVPEWYIDSCRKITYLFPKAHAGSYVMSAIRHGFYKLYYPLEYYAAFFTVKRLALELSMCQDGYEAIRKLLLELPEPESGRIMTGSAPDKRILEVALEMSARGMRLVQGTSGAGEWFVEGMNRRIRIGASGTLEQLNV